MSFREGDLVTPGEDLNVHGWYEPGTFLGRVEAVIGDEVVVDWFKRASKGPKRGRYLVTSVVHADIVTRVGDLAE